MHRGRPRGRRLAAAQCFWLVRQRSSEAEPARQKQAAELATCARAGKCQSGRKAPRPWLTATCTRGQRAVPPAIKCSRCAGPVSRVYARMCAHRPHPRRGTAGCWCSGPRTGCSGRRLERWDHCAACPWPGGAFLPRSGPLRVRPLCAFQAISLAHARRFYFERGVFPAPCAAGNYQTHHPTQKCAVQISDLSKDPIGPAPWGLSSADILEKSKIRTAHF